MTKFRLLFILVFLTALTGTCRAQATPAQSAHELIKNMVYNELHGRETEGYWQYRIVKTTGSQTVVEEQVETRQGPIFRILERNGRLLAGEQLTEETVRLNHLIHSPSELAKDKQKHEDDEQRLQRLMRLMPGAFLFAYDGPPSGDEILIKFWPNPAFTPPTYEARVYHGLAGTCLINTRYKRLADMHGKLIARIDFGYGLLGHIEKGGTFEIGRKQVSPTQWRTDLVDVHVQGRVVLFKTVTKDEHEVRSQFKPVPAGITLKQAKELLDAAAGISD